MNIHRAALVEIGAHSDMVRSIELVRQYLARADYNYIHSASLPKLPSEYNLQIFRSPSFGLIDISTPLIASWSFSNE